MAYLPLSLKARLEERRSASGTPYTLIALEALDATRDQLRDRWRSEHTGTAFKGWDRRRRQQHSEPVQPVTLRLIPEDEDTVDGMWREAGAPNRSAYIIAALDLHLSDPSPAKPAG